MAWLQGKKTMLGSLAAGLTLIAWSLNLLDDEAAKALLGVIAAWTGIALRLAVKD